MVKTSRRLELLNVILSGSRLAGLSTGCALRPRLLAQRLDRRSRTALLDAVADDALELGSLARRGGWSRRARPPSVLDRGAVELILLSSSRARLM